MALNQNQQFPNWQVKMKPMDGMKRNDGGLSLMSKLSDWDMNQYQHIWNPPTDVYETPNNIFVRIEIAGVIGDDFDIHFENGILLVRGVRNDISERKAFHRMEIRYGIFEAKLEISIPIDAGKIQAEYRDGFLDIILPKAESKRIQIKPD